MSNKYNIQFLEEKLGQFDKKYKYPRISLIEGAMLYVEKQTKSELEDEITLIKTDESMNPTYVWGFVAENNAIYVTRTFGENKVFIFNPTSMKKTEYVKGKLKVLNELQKETIDNLFDQKAVFDYFYKKLWDLRLELGREIRDKNDIPDNIALMEAQHIIDRIIFTYFICEKKLVFVKDYGPITGKELFSDIIGQLPDTWDYLKKLFFEQFARSGVKDLACGGEVYIKTPYLNGGLFRPKIISKISEKDLKIEFDWNEIFDPLNKYSWIIEDEITDLEGEYEGNLTPEIIGHIYEKFVITMETLEEIKLEEINLSKKGDLQKGNKKIGAYYTPEHITDYISRNTITPSIFKKLGITTELDFQEFITQSDSHKLLNALQSLNELKICDPACGSGAFLIKAGEILLEYKIKILEQLKNENIDRYELKKEIITKNLYGVDIQRGAVEICKLRLWLWLISSSKNQIVEPLPNIEYNYLVGNSLVGWVNEKLEQSVLVQVDSVVLVILDALKLHFKSEKIDEIKDKLLKTDMRSYAEAMSLLKNIYSYSTEEEAEQLKSIIEAIKGEIYKKVDGVFYLHLKTRGIKISREEYDSLRPFHWNVDFNIIFEDGGFDLVIGNPPYIRLERLKNNERNYFFGHYATALQKCDIFSFFIERSNDILKLDGLNGFIISSSWLSQHSFFKLRRFILNNFRILQILKTPKKTFIGATVETIIFLSEKTDEIQNDHFLSSLEILDDGSLINKKTIPQRVYNDSADKIFILDWDPKESKIEEKLENSVRLGDICSISFGIMTGDDNKFTYYEKKHPSEDKKVLRGGNISKYSIEWSGEYVWYNPIEMKKHKSTARPADSERFENLKIIVKREGAGSISGALDFNNYYSIGSTFIINGKNKNFNLKYVLGLLNSKLLNFWYKKRYKTVTQSINSYKKVPIKEANINQQERIISKVDQIMRINEDVNSKIKILADWVKRENIKPVKTNQNQQLSSKKLLNGLKKIKINSIENKGLKQEFTDKMDKIYNLIQNAKKIQDEIDLIVYELYELTDDEINIIEKTFR